MSTSAKSSNDPRISLLDELKLRLSTKNSTKATNNVNHSQVTNYDEAEKERSAGSICVVSNHILKDLDEPGVIPNDCSLISNTTTDISELDRDQEEISACSSNQKAPISGINADEQLQSVRNRPALKCLWEQLMKERNDHHKTAYTLESLQNMYYDELRKNAALQNTVDKLRLSSYASNPNLLQSDQEEKRNVQVSREAKSACLSGSLSSGLIRSSSRNKVNANTDSVLFNISRLDLKPNNELRQFQVLSDSSDSSPLQPLSFLEDFEPNRNDFIKEMEKLKDPGNISYKPYNAKVKSEILVPDFNNRLNTPLQTFRAEDTRNFEEVDSRKMQTTAAREKKSPLSVERIRRLHSSLELADKQSVRLLNKSNKMLCSLKQSLQHTFPVS